ncbi:MAG: DUF1127 domain-containing protein [Reyranellales bacterium]
MTWRSLLQTLREWRHRALSRREIAKLEDRDIRDLGLSPGQMHFEARKPFWRG